MHPYCSGQAACIRMFIGFFSFKVKTILHEFFLSCHVDVSSLHALSLFLLLEVLVLCTEVGHSPVTGVTRACLTLLIDDCRFCNGVVRSSTMVVDLIVGIIELPLFRPHVLLVRFHIDVWACQRLSAAMSQD